MGKILNTAKFNQVFLAIVNGGVLLSVILLIFEMRQNQDIAVAQIRNDISRQVVERDMFMSSPEISVIFNKAISGENLTGLETFQFNRVLGIIMQGLENIVYQYEAGMYTDEEFQSVERRIEALPPIMLQYYRASEPDYSASFQQIMARIHGSE